MHCHPLKPTEKDNGRCHNWSRKEAQPRLLQHGSSIPFICEVASHSIRHRTPKYSVPYLSSQLMVPAPRIQLSKTEMPGASCIAMTVGYMIQIQPSYTQKKSNRLVRIAVCSKAWKRPSLRVGMLLENARSYRHGDALP